MSRIVVIEDNPVISTIYQKKFQMEGFEVLVANDGEVGLNLVIEQSPDLVVLDLILPKKNGIEILRGLKSNSETTNIPVIVLSNASTTELARDAEDLGVSCVLNKNHTRPNDVITTARDLLTNSCRKFDPERYIKGFDLDTELRVDLQKACVRNGIDTLEQLKATITNLDAAEENSKPLYECYARIHSLASTTSLAGFSEISQICRLFEAHLKDLYTNPENMESCRGTLIEATDTLLGIFELPDFKPKASLILCVGTFDKTLNELGESVRVMRLDQTEVALSLLSANRVDLVILSPGIDDSILSKMVLEIHSKEANQKTPILYSASSVLPEAHKVSLHSELLLKTSILLVKEQIEPLSAQRAL
jgi:CheY-like chemotaxis protein